MFPILLAARRPLFFRNRLWSDKDESFKAVFDVLTPHANSLIIRFLIRQIAGGSPFSLGANSHEKQFLCTLMRKKGTPRIEQNYIREDRRISGEVSH
jgi:hypothetical protein